MLTAQTASPVAPLSLGRNPLPDREQIEALIAKCEAATGPDREIDRRMSGMFGERNAFGTLIVADHWIGVATFSSSIDDIVWLVELKLPGWAWKVTRDYARDN